MLQRIIMLVIGIVMIGVGAAMIPGMVTGWEAARTSQSIQADTFTGVDTTDKTGDNVSLTQTLFNNDLTQVRSIASNTTTDVPVASGYVAPLLAVSGLTINATHTLVVTYDYGTVGYFTGLSNVIAVGPTIVVLGFIITGGVVGFLGLKGFLGGS